MGFYYHINGIYRFCAACDALNRAHEGECNISDDIEVNTKGGKQSKINARYDLLPPNAIRRMAETSYEGSLVYENDNRFKVSSAEHYNHAMSHLFKHQCGDTKEDHVGHALWRFAFWVEMIEREREK